MFHHRLPYISTFPAKALTISIYPRCVQANVIMIINNNLTCVIMCVTLVVIQNNSFDRTCLQIIVIR